MSMKRNQIIISSRGKVYNQKEYWLIGQAYNYVYTPYVPLIISNIVFKDMIKST